MQFSQPDPILLTKIKDELEIYNNFATIASKLDHEGYLNFLVQSLDTVFVNEIDFALGGKVTRSSKNKQKSAEYGNTKAYRDKYIHIQGEYEDTVE